MKFKKMEINGFKSFADKTDIKFGTGVTAIVGPNGCGKSNVADSIRFALGEQSSKTLRGGNMQDVIFGGTEKRKSQSFCEVSLYFDNTEHIFRDLNYDEVVITRKLFRSNESEYLINKTPCRRSDIIEALRDSGVGKEGYSIIGQGKIDELISSKPEDRRSIFDEAAGISKFKAKKLEAERRLVRTRDNLSRLTDILNEKSKQLAPLAKQAQTARVYRELYEKLKNFEINIYLHQYETTTETKNYIIEKRNELIEKLSACRAAGETAVDNYNRTMAEINSTDETIAKHNDELVRLSVSQAQSSGQIDTILSEIKFIVEKCDGYLSDIAKYEADIRNAETAIANGTKLRDGKVSVLAALRSKAEETDAAWRNTMDKIAASEGEEEKSHQSLIDAMEKLTEIKANMSKLLTEKDSLNSQITSLRDKVISTDESNKDKKRTVDVLHSQLEKEKSLRDETGRMLDDDVRKNNENLSKLSGLNSELSKLNAKYYTMMERRDLFTKLRDENGSFERSVSKLLAAAKSDSELSSRIEGVVAHIIQVPKAYETAVEMALGGAVQNIITRTEDEATYIINVLKSRSFGRVTFLPMSTIKPRRIRDEQLGYINSEGCFGVAADLVSYDQKYDNIVRYLLGTTVIVDDIKTGIRIARASRYAFRIVTLDGDIINPAGSITGGSKKADVANVFAYDRELREMEEQLTGVSEKIADYEKQISKLTEEQNTLSLAIKKRSSDVHDLDVSIAAHEQQYIKLSKETEETDRELGEQSAQLLLWETRVDEITKDINSVGELENLVQSRKESALGEGEQSSDIINELRADSEKQHAELTRLRIEIANTENEIANEERDIQRLSSVINTSKSETERLRALYDEHNAQAEAKRADVEKLRLSVSENDSNRVKELKNLIAGFGEYKQKIQNDLNKFDAERIRLSNELNELTELRNAEDLKLQKVDTDLEQMQQRISEVYKLTYDECLPFRTADFDIENAIAEAQKLRRKIDNLGHVNPDAIEECERLYTEYNEMEKQKDDLSNAERDLVKIISDLSKEMKTVFAEKFKQINDNFKIIFKELFDGGTAELSLTEPEIGQDELSAGVEIKAQPPQKKLQLLSLLSGGEKAMTAIAILFAILKLRPMPFCVLDEIEAALDDANVLRFAKYLKRFSQETQFIVITHRKPTMELADALYGVTMEEKGVSKMVSVKLADAVKLAE